MIQKPSKKKYNIFLGAVLSVNLLFLLYLGIFFKENGYLPAPFISDKGNTFMDFFNVLYWADRDGIYTVWESVYPPLNFLILSAYQIIALPEFNYFSDGFEIRKFVDVQIIFILLFYVLCLWVTLKVVLRDVKAVLQKTLLYLAIFLSSLFLFSLERANLIIICLPFIAFYVVAKNEFSKATIFAIIVNLKPYLFIFYLVQLLNRKSHAQNKDFLVLAPTFTLLLFIGSGFLLNQEFYVMPLNLVGFSTQSGVVSAQEVLAFPSSIASFSAFKNLLNDEYYGSLLYKIPTLVCLIYLLKTILLIRRNYIKQDYLIVFAVVLLLNLPIHVGGYAALLYVPIISLLYRNREFFLLGLIIMSSFCSLWDFIPLIKYQTDNSFSYLSDQDVLIHQQLSIGSLVRPIANFIALVYLVNKTEKDTSEKII